MPLNVIPPPGSGTPTGAAGGDLSGNFPNPSVSGVGGAALTATAAEINKLHSVVAGTVSVSKALVVDANKALDALVIAALSLGAGAGTALTATATEINKLASVVAGTVSASKALVVDANKRLDTLVIGTLNLGAGTGTAVSALAGDLNLLAGMAAATEYPAHVAVVPLAAVDTGGGVISWQNPLAVTIQIHRTVVRVTTKASAACSLDVGTTAASGTTSSDTLIDGLDVGTGAGTFDVANQAGANGKPYQTLAAGKWVTGSTDSGASAGLVGFAYIHYSPA